MEQLVMNHHSHHDHGSDSPKITLVGNPNVGKSLIFNQLTGIHQKVANFPGITLEYLEGEYKLDDQKVDIIDLPGIYGFVSSKKEEQVAHNYLISTKPDLIINVIDGRRLERNLSLTLQLLEMGLPMLVVLTFRDRIKNVNIDLDHLSEVLGVPVIAVNSHSSKDIRQIKYYIQDLLENPQLPSYKIDLDNDLYHLVDDLKSTIASPLIIQGDTQPDFSHRWVIINSILGGRKMSAWPSWMVSRIYEYLHEKKGGEQGISKIRYDLITSYYNDAESLAQEVLGDSYDIQSNNFLSKLDNYLLHPVYGLLIFVGLMFTMFSLTITLTDPIIVLMETYLDSLSAFILETLPYPLLASFLADGIIGGIGFVLVFLPQIMVLFVFIGILEHSGYLARMVFVTDRYLSKIGITGTSVAPLLLGFGCNVPGVMATKSIANYNERITIGLVNPFMSCSARLPVYLIIASALYTEHVGLVVTALYLLGIVIAVGVMYLLRNTVLKGEGEDLIMELPDLMMPSPKAIYHQVYRHVRKFVANAATWMALGIVMIWVLSIFGPSGYLGSEAMQSTELMKQSWIYFIGSVLSPVFAPLGWDTRLVVALVLGFVAKEIVVGSLGVIYGVGGSTALLKGVIASQFTAVSGFAFLAFVLIYTPCIGTYFTMRQELGKKWANISVVFSLALAYILAILITIIGNLII